MDANTTDWELVTEVSSQGLAIDRTSRLRVPSGWLYRYERDTEVSEESRQYAVAMVFVPDPLRKAKKVLKARRLNR